MKSHAFLILLSALALTGAAAATRAAGGAPAAVLAAGDQDDPGDQGQSDQVERDEEPCGLGPGPLLAGGGGWLHS